MDREDGGRNIIRNVGNYESKGCHSSEDPNIHQQYCENLKSHPYDIRVRLKNVICNIQNIQCEKYYSISKTVAHNTVYYGGRMR
jgi:hypothetical protein